MDNKKFILTLSCADIPAIVHTVSGFITQNKGFILESRQYGDPNTNRFFMRVYFLVTDHSITKNFLLEQFETDIAKQFDMDWKLYENSEKQNILILVSKFGHCLNDLLHRYKSGALNANIPAIISNHNNMREMAEWYNIPFYHLPITKETKPEQEVKILEIIKTHNIDLTVLARYMQILSNDMCQKLNGKAINIHHSFLPSFKGAKPYHQAHKRGVKLIGATAHYVTPDLDEGPIIEQEVTRVHHAHTAENLVEMGGDTESRVLARAVKLHLEHRLFLNNDKTVVFDS